ncbi:hypothetical protein [Reyranella sp.]|uniref:hypothetical protein n=1 Tax=Reyranella sp. TaxID=1929291 RepID=UPI003D0CA98D
MGARSTFFSLFKLGDKVAIDGDASIRATVIGFAFYPHVEQVQVAWFANGSAQEAWIASFRLEVVE